MDEKSILRNKILDYLLLKRNFSRDDLLLILNPLENKSDLETFLRFLENNKDEINYLSRDFLIKESLKISGKYNNKK